MPEVDTDEVIKEADEYVRDHLLIQFMQICIESGTPISIDIEEWYKAWISWLKEKENEHGKRS